MTPATRTMAAPSAALPAASPIRIGAGSIAREHRRWSAAAARPVDADAAAGTLLVTLICVGAASGSGGFHWSLVPLGTCGALEAPTIVRWLRGKYDPFDPKALATLLIFHNTFLAPLLHLAWDWYTPLIRVPDDPAAWFGRLALLNVVSLLCLEAAYRLT